MNNIIPVWAKPLLDNDREIQDSKKYFEPGVIWYNTKNNSTYVRKPIKDERYGINNSNTDVRVYGYGSAAKIFNDEWSTSCNETKSALVRSIPLKDRVQEFRKSTWIKSELY